MPERSREIGVRATAATLVAVVLCWMAPALRGDVVVLANGDRIEGQVVSETAAHVAIRRRFRDGDILFVQNIPRDSVVRIERGRAASQPTAADSMPADSSGSREPAWIKDKEVLRPTVDKWNSGTTFAATDLPSEIKDKPRFLNQTIAKWNAKNVQAAASDLTRLLTSATRAELNDLSPECERQVGMALAEFAAEAHWRAALSRTKSGPVRLIGVTPYEISAMVPRLVKEYEVVIHSEIHPLGAGPASAHLTREDSAATQPSSKDAVTTRAAEQATPEPSSALTIANWINRPNELNVSRPEAAALAARVVYANSLINERIRLDPAVRRDRGLQSAVIGQRTQLIGLLHAAIERASGGTPAEKRTARSDQRRARQNQGSPPLPDAQIGQDTEQQSLLRKAIQLAQESAVMDQTNPPPAAPAQRHTPTPGASQ